MDSKDKTLEILWGTLDSDMQADSSSTRAAYSRLTESIITSGRHIRRRTIMRIAAILAIPVTVLGTGLILNSRKAAENTEWIQTSAAAGTTASALLPDGTKVSLNSGSKLIYPSEFKGSKRQIFFDGEGYFDVFHDRRHPFEITTDGAGIRVLGTKFNLKSYSDENTISIALFEGCVEFEAESADGTQEISRITPGEHISYSKGFKTRESDKFSNNEYSSWMKGHYYFKNERLDNIAHELERIYGVRIVITRDDIKSMNYYMSLVNGETIDDIVAILQSDKRLKVKKYGKTIEIN